eukprot:1165953-Prymnesium_polylepis.1
MQPRATLAQLAALPAIVAATAATFPIRLQLHTVTGRLRAAAPPAWAALPPRRFTLAVASACGLRLGVHFALGSTAAFLRPPTHG